MTNSRDAILGRLYAAQKPFPSAQMPSERLEVSQLAGESRDMLTARFSEEAQKLDCDLHMVSDAYSAIEAILKIIAGEELILAWDFNQIPCPQLEAALHEAGVTVASPGDPSARIGITGVDAALATTGSLVIVSGPGRSRTTGLLPQTHIALITEDQILPNMEIWLERQRQNNLEAFRQAANINIISGPSRTADIAMELILGMHGPSTLHIVIIEN